MHEKDCLSQRDLFWIVVLNGEMTQTQKFYVMQMLSARDLYRLWIQGSINQGARFLAGQ